MMFTSFVKVSAQNIKFQRDNLSCLSRSLCVREKIERQLRHKKYSRKKDDEGKVFSPFLSLKWGNAFDVFASHLGRDGLL